MRPDKNFMPSPACKVHLLEIRFGGDYGEIAMAMDDRADVVAAFREIGITAFQVFAKMGCAQRPQEELDELVRKQNILEHGVDTK
jgi:hypothetical protein